MALRTIITPLGGKNVRALLQAQPLMRKAVAAEVRKSALRVQSMAKKRSPVETGRLKQSITTVYVDQGLTAVVGTNVTSPTGYPYARRQEYDEHLRHTPPVRHKTRAGWLTGRRGGEWGYLRKSLRAEAVAFRTAVQRVVAEPLRAVLRRMGGTP